MILRKEARMKLSRRQFLTLSIGSFAGTALSVLGAKKADAELVASECRIKKATISHSICCFCGVGCGVIVHTSEGKVINIEGDPEHPINEGSVCSKGASLLQVAVNERRAKKVLHRKPGAIDWEEISWEEAINAIAEKIRETRNASLIEKDGDFVVNRNEGIAALGGAALDNEECYLYSKLMRALGLVYIEHQARI